MNGDINPDPKYTVGQCVWVSGHNVKSPYRATVTKVGRKLVTVSEPYGRLATYRIDTGRANDGHHWIKTEEEQANNKRSAELHTQLRSLGLEVRIGRKLRLEALEAVVKALEESPQTDQNSVAGTTTPTSPESG